jgi:protein required for attachment to host cells
MLLPSGCTVAVADGVKLVLFHNTGREGQAQLTASPQATVNDDHSGSDTGHRNSAANPDQAQVDEDGFSVGIADLLNRQVLCGDITQLVIIAPARTLGGLRKHYHQKLSAILLREIGKELTGHTVQDIEKAIQAA